MDLLQSIGKTPLIRLAKLTAGLDAEILVKVESRNPGGSIKDRAALRMIQGALEKGTLKPNGTIVEPTSGNTGIGLAVVSTCMGFKLILTMPESMSDERKALLRGFGAELILTPAAKGMGGAVEEAQRLAATEGYVLLDQFSNPDNAEAHYRTTGPEILSDAGTVDAFVAGVGTGGTITGTGRYLREHLPSVGLFAVEPAESAVLSGNPAGPHLIQGIGAGFVPALLDRSLLTEVLPIPGLEAIKMARRVMTRRGRFLRHFIQRQRRGGASSGEQTGMERKAHCDGSARHRRALSLHPAFQSVTAAISQSLKTKRTAFQQAVLFVLSCHIRLSAKSAESNKSVTGPQFVRETSMSAANTPCWTRPGSLDRTSSTKC